MQQDFTNSHVQSGYLACSITKMERLQTNCYRATENDETTKNSTHHLDINQFPMIQPVRKYGKASFLNFQDVLLFYILVKEKQDVHVTEPFDETY